MLFISTYGLERLSISVKFFCFNFLISMSCLDLLRKAVCIRTVDLTDTVNLPNKVILWAPAVLEYLHSLAYSVALILGALGSLNLCYDMKRSYINIVEISFEFSFFLVFY